MIAAICNAYSEAQRIVLIRRVPSLKWSIIFQVLGAPSSEMHLIRQPAVWLTALLQSELFTIFIQNYAVLDPAFHGNFSCPRKPHSVSLDGAVLALCRICKNITDPANGLVLNRSAQCLPLLSNNDLSCLLSEVWRYRSYKECRDMFYPNSDSPSVAAHFDVDESTTDQTHSLRYLSMAFRSVSLEYIVVYTCTIVLWKSAHGWSTLKVCQRGGWALFWVFPHLTMKERPCHVYMPS